MVDKTKYVNRIQLTDEQYLLTIKAARVLAFQNVISDLANRFNAIFLTDCSPIWRKIKNEDLYYIHTLNLFIADIKKIKITQYSLSTIPGLDTTYLDENDARILFAKYSLSNPFLDISKRIYIQIDDEMINPTMLWLNNNRRYRWTDDSIQAWGTEDNTLRLPVSYLNKDYYKIGNRLFWFFLNNDFCVFEDEKDCILFDFICQLNKSGNLKYEDEKIIISPKRDELISDNSILNDKIISDFTVNEDELRSILFNTIIPKVDEDNDIFKEFLLSCDEQRTHMEKYSEHILVDPESGHWDLWLEDDTDTTIKIEESLVARNPVYDALINKTGVVGIDFGTKSTVVTYRKNTADVIPMRIGSGQYSRAVAMSDYENPTVMEVRNIESFIKNYRSKKGRPDTKWNDLLISHEAYSQLIYEQKSGDTFASFFGELKQWAFDKEKQVMLRDLNDTKICIPPYMMLKEEEFDPIEIYAYYIGLYINNMHNNNIFLRYRLSFPAKAEKHVREKILNSFEKGIKKSLPEPVLENEDCMKLFRIEQGVSEPAAYAICALQEYGFDPGEKESVYYGIFDFGGGTTDFDFGVWSSEEDDDNYDYRISRFGEGEDPYLGGENILGILAYEVFLDNYFNLLKDNIIFIKPYGSKIEVGKDWLVKQDSQYAQFNFKRVMERLRGVWENDTETRTLFESGTIQVPLFDSDGNSHNNYSLSVKIEKLDRIIKEKIESGVSQFFSTLKNSFDIGTSLSKIQKITEINIFLAGNSCKSKVVLEVFKHHIELLYDSMGCYEENRWIKIYPPLGTLQAEKIKKGLLKPDIDEILNDIENINTDNEIVCLEALNKEENQEMELIINGIKKPNGKTGVAFGLLDNRVKITQNERDESRFKYYIGQNRKKKFSCVIDKDKVDYGIWKRFCTASVDTFYIWFTRSSEAPSNSMDINTVGIYSELGFISAPDEKESVYIRLVSPTEIEYIVSEMDETEINCNSNNLTNIERISLQEKE